MARSLRSQLHLSQSAARHRSRIYSGFMKRQSEGRGEFAAEFKVCIRFLAAQPMMQMRCVQHQPQFPAPIDKRAQQRNGISPAGKPDGEPHPGLQQRRVERECGRQCAH